MLLRRRPLGAVLALALGAALTSVSSAPARADSPSSTTPTTAAPATTTPTTKPPAPPAFSLPIDIGEKLVADQNKARHDLTVLGPELLAARAQTGKAEHDLAVVNGFLRNLDAKSRKNAALLTRTRTNLRVAAANAYVHAGSGQLDAALSTFADAKSAVDMASQIHMIGSYGQDQRDALEAYLAVKKSVDKQISDLSDRQDRVAAQLRGARDHMLSVQAQITDAHKREQSAALGILQFQAAAVSSTSPILGPSRLTAKQLADFIGAKGYKPRITVSIQELAQDYIEEGNRYGVRGDVAFAQSILETAGFHLPDGGQLNPNDNNFAGIGACDSCKHGISFPDARTGVRAQIQLLRIYVDKNFGPDNSPDPILLKGTLKLGFRGKVQTWWDLWGTWATGALYGEHVYDLYLQIVAFAATDPPNYPPTPLPPPRAPAPGASTPTTAP